MASFETCQTKSIIVLFVANHLVFRANTCLFWQSIGSSARCSYIHSYMFSIFFNQTKKWHRSTWVSWTFHHNCQSFQFLGLDKPCLCTANVPALHWPFKGPCSACCECRVVCLVTSLAIAPFRYGNAPYPALNRSPNINVQGLKDANIVLGYLNDMEGS